MSQFNPNLSALNTGGVTGTGGVGKSAQSLADMEKVAQEFEAVFLAQILNGLTNGLEGDGPLAGAESDPFASMLQDEYAKMISKSGGVGISDAVLKEMLKIQEIE